MTADLDAQLATTPTEELLKLELFMSGKGASTFLIDGGAAASYYYGPLKPEA